MNSAVLRPVATVAAALLLTACTTDSVPEAESRIGDSGEVTLTVWDQELVGGQDVQMEKLNEAFHRKYPNVRIRRVKRSLEDLRKALHTARVSDSPPDVVQVNQGYADMARLVAAKRLRPLDSYDHIYGWSKRYPKGLLDINSVTPDGRTVGSGSLYGVSLNGEIVGIFYNRKKLARLGLRPPSSWAGFERALAIAKDRGEVPISLGNRQPIPVTHSFGVIQDQVAGKRAVRDLFFGRGGSWTDAANLRAARTLQEWVRRGYLVAHPGKLAYDDDAFAAGEGVFLIGGTWFASGLGEHMGGDVGFVLPPPARAGGAPTTMGGESLPFAVTAESEHPDVAATYLDFISSPQAMDVVTEAGLLPALRPRSRQPRTAVLKDVFAAWDTLSRTDGLTPYIDNATPTFPDVLGNALLGLVAGRTGPRDGMAEVQKNYAAFLTARR
ncbi:ABC transporter substrate-binding protein [Actinomadura sp. NEAU-AAG7]|uniref:ABC transporter substrate-binding protein n=1 Tax=Actinomadura sp. NEAU-AAG7 TaxID=2839640 RepID=UPI001BE3E267|nr:extracellular solute-binding protein [Actinomadura sp. NEAU-AAG7]MBT2209271.1 extracellular solute-binding protein [Actinomadura sp. NEAU-AAG7]